MLSQGVPMVLMGDEMGRSQRGNNNAYCHDNDVSWVDWTLLEKNAELFRYAREVIAFRYAHPVLRRREPFTHTDVVGSGYPDISFHGTHAWAPDWDGTSRVLAWMLCGKHARVPDDYIYVAANAHWEALQFMPPAPPFGMCWHVFANTSIAPPDDIHEVGKEPRLTDGPIILGPRSIMVLVGR